MALLYCDGVTVLVVDDSDDVRTQVCVKLRLAGYDVVEARDGREAIEVAKATRPALILMDIQMPVMDGLTATRMIRQIQGLCGTRVVAFSACGADYHRLAVEAGCDDYVSKGGGVSQLAGIVRQHLTPG